uniref:Ubiquinone biosynthesis O-methyltransferase, mitochondrial n=1 Tax=Clastoptera arizonana TaxID=38151 RepID=A0A1B6DMM7_9HEMI
MFVQNNIFRNRDFGTLLKFMFSKHIVTSNKTLSTRMVKNKTKTPSPPTYDEDEVQKHEALAGEWWALNGPMKALHTMNTLRIPFIQNGLIATHQLHFSDIIVGDTYLTGKQILDVGCGGGILSEALARLGASVTGIDPSEELINLATLHIDMGPKFRTKPPTYIATTVENHVKKFAHSYDVVVASEVIEHVSNKKSFVKSCVKALKPGGSIFFTTPSKTWISWFGTIVVGEHILRILPKGTHQYDKFISYTNLSDMLEKEDCNVKSVDGMFYNALWNKWSWTNTKALMYALHAVSEK